MRLACYLISVLTVRAVRSSCFQFQWENSRFDASCMFDILSYCTDGIESG